MPYVVPVQFDSCMIVRMNSLVYHGLGHDFIRDIVIFTQHYSLVQRELSTHVFNARSAYKISWIQGTFYLCHLLQHELHHAVYWLALGYPLRYALSPNIAFFLFSHCMCIFSASALFDSDSLDDGILRVRSSWEGKRLHHEQTSTPSSFTKSYKCHSQQLELLLL